jgi:hypothetical protein
MRLPRSCLDVLEVGVVMQDHRAMVFSHRGSQQVDDSSGTMDPRSRMWLPPDQQ